MRKQRGIEQWVLANLAGVQPSSISNFERGKRKPSFDTLERLADTLMVSVDYLMGRTENPLAHAIVEEDGRIVTKLWRREEIAQVEAYINYVKEQGAYRVDSKGPSDAPDPEPEPK